MVCAVPMGRLKLTVPLDAPTENVCVASVLVSELMLQLSVLDVVEESDTVPLTLTAFTGTVPEIESDVADACVVDVERIVLLTIAICRSRCRPTLNCPLPFVAHTLISAEAV